MSHILSKIHDVKGTQQTIEGTFDETKPLPKCFRRVIGFFESCRLETLGLKLNKVSIEADSDDRSIINVEKNLPLDEKMSYDDYKIDSGDDDVIQTSEETDSFEIQWANFHRCKNRITFALQFVTVITIQGMNSTL